MKLILKYLIFKVFFCMDILKLSDLLCPPSETIFSSFLFFPFCSPTGRLLKKWITIFFQCFFQKFLKKKKKNPFCCCKIFNARKKDLLYNYIYYINTYLDKTIYKSGQSFKKNQNKFSICFFRICNHKKIKKKKLVKF